MSKFRNLSRRALLRNAALMAGGVAANRILGGGNGLWGEAHAQSAEKPAVLVVILNGGYQGAFSSANSFPDGTFGLTAGNRSDLGNDLVVDSATLGALPQYARTHMATIGVVNGTTAHGTARVRNVSSATRSYPLMLAAALGGDAAIKCAVMGSQGLDGVSAPESGVSLQNITNLAATIAALGGQQDATIPDRAIASAGLAAAQQMSMKQMSGNPKMLSSVKEGFAASIETLKKPVQPFSFATLAQAYGKSVNATTVNDFASKVMGAELMMTAGTNVAVATDGGWDTHGDTSANNARNMFTQNILPPLQTFVNRMMNVQGRNVVVAILGDFARSLPGSDHATALAATVIGKYVKVGTTGKLSPSVSLPNGPDVESFWSYLAAVAKAPQNPFKANPHNLVLT